LRPTWSPTAHAGLCDQTPLADGAHAVRRGAAGVPASGAAYGIAPGPAGPATGLASPAASVSLGSNNSNSQQRTLGLISGINNTMISNVIVATVIHNTFKQKPNRTISTNSANNSANEDPILKGMELGRRKDPFNRK
jgi:hypothetical protein